MRVGSIGWQEDKLLSFQIKAQFMSTFEFEL